MGARRSASWKQEPGSHLMLTGDRASTEWMLRGHNSVPDRQGMQNKNKLLEKWEAVQENVFLLDSIPLPAFRVAMKKS